MIPVKKDDKKIIDLLNTIPGLGYGEIMEETKHLDAIAILSLPSNLRKTALALVKVTKADIASLSKITGNDEKVEGLYLEELFIMGYLKKDVTSLNVYYEIK